MKNAVSAMILILGTLFPTAANSESQVVFRQANHECTLDYDRSAFVVSSIDSENYRRFSRPDPETYFRVTALANDENMTPEKIRNGYLLKRGRKDLVYDLTKGQFLVLSGYRGQNIFYTKIALSGDNKTICVLDIFYPRKLRRSMDSEVTRMSQSFAAKN